MMINLYKVSTYKKTRVGKINMEIAKNALFKRFYNPCKSLGFRPLLFFRLIRISLINFACKYKYRIKKYLYIYLFEHIFMVY